ncbi:hypothetical protein V1460_28975 [Streptomyces sp. SCSIO 30461]|uniref:hypothetical protein n=1 Tax=Streptomyces sp. SCSIO 30461 TaxID=3118085 RepID=UPI0030D34BDA
MITTQYAPYGETRELLAAGKAALDAAFEPEPTFLGRKEPGVAKALAADISPPAG